VKYNTGESNLNVKIPEGTTAELLLTDKEGKATRLNFDCVSQFFLGKPQDTIGNFNSK